MSLSALAASLMLSFMPAAQADAPPPVANPGGVVADLSFEDVVPVLQQAGLEAEVVPFGGKQVIRVADPQSGTVLALSPRACKSTTHCAGLWMFALLDDQASDNELGLFNSMSMAVRAGVQDNPAQTRAVVLDRYMIADYGTTRGSLVINARVMLAMVPQWYKFKEMAGDQRMAVSFAPAADGWTDEQAALVRAVSREPGMINRGLSHNSVTGGR